MWQFVQPRWISRGSTLDRTKQHGNVWKTRILGDTVVFFAGPKAFSFFMNPEHFTRQDGSPRFLQDLLHADAVPFLDGERHKARKRLLLSAFTDQALDSSLVHDIIAGERRGASSMLPVGLRPPVRARAGSGRPVGLGTTMVIDATSPIGSLRDAVQATVAGPAA
jgi:hypothetical protein